MSGTVLGLSVIPPGVGQPLTFLVLGWLSVLLMGAAKSGFGGSVGMLSVPLMVYACAGNGPLATGIMLPVLIVCDYVSLVFWWRQWDARNVLMLVPGMVLGIGAGWVVLWLILGTGGSQADLARPSAALNLVIGLVAVGFVLLQLVRWFRGELRVFRPLLWHALLAGSSAGLVSTLAHTAGPITNMYLLPQQMPKGRFVATTVLYYWIGNQVKVIPYLALGLLSPPALSANVVLLPGVLVGALLGVFLHSRLDEKWFAIIVYALLGAIGGHLMVTSAAALCR